MSKVFMIVFVAIALLMYFASAPEEDEKGAPQPPPMVRGITAALMKHLESAMVTASGNLQCGYSSEGGYAYSTPADAAIQLVKVMNLSNEPMPGEPKVRGPNVSYALNTPSKPWQIVVAAEEGAVTLTSYAGDPKTPVDTQRVPCE